MLGNIGSLEIALIALILLVLFGAKRIPALMGSIGEGIRELKNSFRSDEVEKPDADGERLRDRRDASRLER